MTAARQSPPPPPAPLHVPNLAWHGGAGRARIALPDHVFPVDGFTAERDPLHARVLLLDDGRARVAVLSLEQTSLRDETVAAVRDLVHREAGVDPQHVVVGVTHTFSAPHVTPADDDPGTDDAGRAALLRTALEDAVRAAAVQAHARLAPVRFARATARSHVAVNRDVRTPHGWWLGADEEGPRDDLVTALRVDDADGAPVAVLFSSAVQPSVLNESRTRSGDRLVSADLAGAAASYVERALPGSVALFLVGAAGDQAPRRVAATPVVAEDGTPGFADQHETEYAVCDVLGDLLGSAVVQAVRAAPTAPPPRGLTLVRDSVELAGQRPPTSFRSLRPSPDYTYVASSPEQVPYVLLDMGGLVTLVGVRPELNARTGADVRERSTTPGTFVACCVDGAAKYLPDAASYERRTYEAMNSRYARGGAEALADALVARLGRLGSARGPSGARA